MGELSYDAAKRRAERWCADWNQRDLDAVMAHYAVDVELCSPLVVRRFGYADGVIRGKAALREYFAIGMGNPALRFQFEDLRLGTGCMTVLYARENGMRVSDTLVLNAAGEARAVFACYAGGQSDV